MVQDGAAEMGIVARMEGRGGDGGRAKHVRSEWPAHGRQCRPLDNARYFYGG